MPFDFPSSPSEGQTFTPSGGPAYVYHAPAWELVPGDNNAGPFNALAFNNIIINGNFHINQIWDDGYFGSNWFGVLATGIMDCWSIVSVMPAIPTGAILNAGTLAPPGTKPFGGAYKSCFSCQVTGAGVPSPAANDLVLLTQPIEFSRIKSLGMGYSSAQPFTVSFWIYATRTGTMCVHLSSAGTVNRAYVREVVITAANTWQYVTLTFPPDVTTPASWDVADSALGAMLTFPLLVGSSQKTLTAGSWQTRTTWATAAQTNFLNSIGDGVAITGVTMLPGSRTPSAALSPLMQRPYGEELYLCQRYYQKVSVVTPGAADFPPWLALAYPTTMRAAPTARAIGTAPGFAVYGTDRGTAMVYTSTWSVFSLELDARA